MDTQAKVFETLDRQQRVRHPRLTEAKLWFAFSLIGIGVAIVAFLMMLAEESLVAIKGEVFEYLTVSGEIMSNFVFFLMFSVVLATSAAMLTVYVGPKAAGSGIPEMIGCLNGLRVEEYLTPTVLVVKAVGVILAIAGTLVVGKEGPLAHIGAIIAIIVMFSPIRIEEFRTNVRYREFVAAGISAGVSVAFGAPMGGALFAYELSGPSTFWTFKLIWRNFFCASIATFSLAVMVALSTG